MSGTLARGPSAAHKPFAVLVARVAALAALTRRNTVWGTTLCQPGVAEGTATILHCDPQQPCEVVGVEEPGDNQPEAGSLKAVVAVSWLSWEGRPNRGVYIIPSGYNNKNRSHLGTNKQQMNRSHFRHTQATNEP